MFTRSPFAQESCATNGRSFLVIVPRPGYRLDNASIFFLTPIAHLSILFTYQNGLHGKIMNKRYGIPLHSIVLLALLLAAGGFARVFSVHANKRVGPLQCAGIHPASPHTGAMPSGFRRGCSILQVKSSAAGPGHTSGGVHLSPCPSSDAGPPVFSHPRVPPPFMARPPALPPSPSFPLIPFPSSSVHPACGPPVPSLSQG